MEVLNLVLVKDEMAICFERNNNEYSRNEHFYIYISFLHSIKQEVKSHLSKNIKFFNAKLANSTCQETFREYLSVLNKILRGGLGDVR